MIRRFLLRVAKQAADEFLNPRLDVLRDELGGRIDAVRDELGGRIDAVEARLTEIDDELKTHSEQLARLDQRVIDLKETLQVEHRLARLEAHAGLGKT